MKKRYVVLLVTSALLLGGLLYQPAANAAQTVGAFITNDTDHPVPTKAVGTTAVNGTVNVGQGSVSVNNDADHAVPVKPTGTTQVAGGVTVDNKDPIKVTSDPGTAEALLDPRAATHVTPSDNGFFALDTSHLSSLRVGAIAGSGTVNCHVRVIVNSVTIDEFNLGQFTDKSILIDTPGKQVIVNVTTSNDCWLFVNAFGIPIS